MRELRIPYWWYKKAYRFHRRVEGSYDPADKTILVLFDDREIYIEPPEHRKPEGTWLRLNYKQYKGEYLEFQHKDYDSENHTIAVFFPKGTELPEVKEYRYKVIEIPYPEWLNKYKGDFKQAGQMSQRTGLIPVRFPEDYEYVRSPEYRNYEKIFSFNAGWTRSIDLFPDRIDEDEFQKEFGITFGEIPDELLNQEV